MEHKKERGAFAVPVVGGSSLLVIFAVLTLTVFALLSLSTVRADERLSLASAQAVSDYYAADCAAQEILAQLLAGEWVEGVEQQHNLYSYSCKISDSQILNVTVQLEDEGGYTVLCWQAVPSGDWKPDDSLHLWDGSIEE